MYGEGEKLDVVRIPATDSFARLGDGGCVEGARHRCDRKTGGGKQYEIDSQAPLSSQLSRVLLDLAKSSLGRQNFLDRRMPKHSGGLPPDQR